jgi:hypothetical protein
MFYIYIHLGLGDAILCNGLIRNLYKIRKDVCLFCSPENVDNIKYMFRDLNLTYQISTDLEAIEFLKKIPEYDQFEIEGNFIRSNIDKYNFDECFYQQINLDYNKRWDDFYIERDSVAEEEIYKTLINFKSPYAFVHDDEQRGFSIEEKYISSDLSIFRPNTNYNVNVFSYLKIIENATEIHCMDSSFKHLIDSLSTVKGKLFYHLYVRGLSNYSWTHSKLNWEPILYR